MGPLSNWAQRESRRSGSTCPRSWPNRQASAALRRRYRPSSAFRRQRSRRRGRQATRTGRPRHRCRASVTPSRRASGRTQSLGTSPSWTRVTTCVPSGEIANIRATALTAEWVGVWAAQTPLGPVRAAVRHGAHSARTATAVRSEPTATVHGRRTPPQRASSRRRRSRPLRLKHRVPRASASRNRATAMSPMRAFRSFSRQRWMQGDDMAADSRRGAPTSPASPSPPQR